MIFKESNYCIELKQTPMTFVYFLLDGDDVVYVGKTNKGIARICNHIDKHFTRAFILPCDKKDLDELEGKYIIKYKPRYNKIPNHKEAFSIRRALDRLNELYLYNHYKKCTKKRLMRMMKELHRSFFMLNNSLYISHEDLLTIENAIEDFLIGENNNETFNLWI